MASGAFKLVKAPQKWPIILVKPYDFEDVKMKSLFIDNLLQWAANRFGH